ncbi:NAC domain-containing protein [Heracleum sosnowskyi]|uniref:NAC domain-containing protein n=1 Tax=Heracleum sosnowskyi TaxID=360622 RepID=A0AAD8I831_9APIA|nr:NAC domain-containing protein [Heracleum sosnowskyi]
MENHQPEHEQLYLRNDNDQVHEIPQEIPPGYRFVPDDVQLIDDYLKVIVDHPEQGGVNGLIFTVNLYGSDPEELTAVHQEQCEKTWYFFTKRNRKYANGTRPDRAAGEGYWKQTNVVQYIFRRGENNKRVKIGRKITLDYYYKKGGKEKDDFRTDWKMTEYRLDGVNLQNNYNSSEFCEWCLCRIYKSKAKKTKDDDNLQVNLQVEAEPNAVAELIAPREHNGHVAGEQYNGQNAGGSGVNYIQQSTSMPSNNNVVWNPMPSNNNAVWNPSSSNYMANSTSGSINGLQYNTDALLIDQQDTYPHTGNAGYVQPLRSLLPSGFPTSSDYSINQSSSGIPDHDLTSEWDFDEDFTFDDFDL